MASSATFAETMDVADRIRQTGGSLTSSERRVAEVILATPQTVGFGTVADLARQSGAGAATVVRLAAKLGYDGYSELQASVQRDLVLQLRPAAERIREAPSEGVIGHHLATELANVQQTLDGVEQARLAAFVERLADLGAPVAVLSGDASRGIAQQFTAEVSSLRPTVGMVDGNDVEVQRRVAMLDSSTTLVVIDLRRYDRWVLDAYSAAVARGVHPVAITDSLLSPLAVSAEQTFVVAAGAVGPFDSHVGTLALLNLTIAELSRALQAVAAPRLEAAEQAWQRGDSLRD